MVSLQPDDAMAHFDLGVALARVGCWWEAAAAYDNAIRLQPDCMQGHTNLGFIYYELGLEGRAQAEFELGANSGGLA